MKRHSRNAFTLVELLVVITIIGMLVALLIPAVTAARASAQQATCTNNQRNYGQAIQEYVMAKDYFPGYRQVLKITSGTVTKNAVISWQVALFPRLGKDDVYQGIQNLTIGISNFSPPASQKLPPLPYFELSACPSDATIVGRNGPFTSYVANCGIQDQLPTPYPAFDSSANGLFMDQVLSPGSKVALNDIKDGQASTIMLSENVDVMYYSDGTADSQMYTYATTTTPTVAALATGSPNCTERGCGMLWWDLSGSSAGSIIKINQRKGDFDPSRVAWAANSSYAARPSSNHSGGVVVVFAAGNTSFLRDDIEYNVYCSLMSPNNVKASITNPNQINPVPLPILNEGDYK
jgi:prepilin-type N-terminal cleavage/methylation domain-containing protein